MCVKQIKVLENPMDEYKTFADRKKAYDLACTQNGVYAVDVNLKKIPLNKVSVKKLAFVGGFWRVQKHFPYEITRVRDKDMVIMDRIKYRDKTEFEYYNAKDVGYNCYGPFTINGNTSDYVVSKSVTNKGVCWGYGKSIESARAFLGLKLLDEYMDVVKAAMNQNIRK